MYQVRQINLRHYQSIYTTSMGFSPHRTEIRQFKIPPTVFSEQTAKFNVHQYFCLYGTYITSEHGVQVPQSKARDLTSKTCNYLEG